MGAELMQARAPTLSVQLAPYPVEVRPSVNTGGGREYHRHTVEPSCSRRTQEESYYSVIPVSVSSHIFVSDI